MASAEDWRMRLLDELEEASPGRVRQIDDLMMCDTPTALETISTESKADDMMNLKLEMQQELIDSAAQLTISARNDQAAAVSLEGPAADPFASFLDELNQRDDEIGKIVAMTPLSPAPDLSPKGGSSIHRNKNVAPAVPEGWKAKWSTRRERWYYASPAGQSQWDLPTAADVELGSREHDSTLEMLLQLQAEFVASPTSMAKVGICATPTSPTDTSTAPSRDKAAEIARVGVQMKQELKEQSAEESQNGTATAAAAAATAAAAAADPFESFLKEINENDDEIGKIVAMTPLSPAPDLSPKGGGSSIHRNKDIAPAVPEGWKAKWSTRRERWYYASPAGQSQWDLPTAADLDHNSTMELLEQLRGAIP